MQDQNLIAKIKTLESIKPDQKWVVLTKKNILGRGLSYQPSFGSMIGHFLFQYKMAVASLILVFMTGGTLVITQEIARINNKDQNPLANLQLAAQKLAELNLISENKLTKDVPAAVKEFAATKAAARKQVLELAQKDPDNAAAIVKAVGSQIQQIDATERQVFADLGINEDALGSSDQSSDSSDKAIVELLLQGSRKAALTSTQQQDLSYAQGLVNMGNYEGALEFYLNSSLSQ